MAIDRAVVTVVRRMFRGDQQTAMGIIENIQHKERFSEVTIVSLDHHRRVFRQFSDPTHVAALKLIEAMFDAAGAERRPVRPVDPFPQSAPFRVPRGWEACPVCSTTGEHNDCVCDRCDGAGIIRLTD